MSPPDWIYIGLGLLLLWIIAAPLVGTALGKILRFCGRSDKKGNQR